MAIIFEYKDKNGWYFDRLLMKDEAFYDGITLLHANTIYNLLFIIPDLLIRLVIWIWNLKNRMNPVGYLMTQNQWGLKVFGTFNKKKRAKYIELHAYLDLFCSKHQISSLFSEGVQTITNNWKSCYPFYGFTSNISKGKQIFFTLNKMHICNMDIDRHKIITSLETSNKSKTKAHLFEAAI